MFKKAKAKSEKAQKVSRKAKAEMKKAQAVTLDAELIEKDILKEARVLKLPAGEAKGFSLKVATKVVKWAEKRGKVTKADVNEKIAEELKKYNKDLAFIFRNRGKII